MWERRCVYRVSVGIYEGRRPLERPRRRWGIILKLIFEKRGGGARTGSMWLRIGTGLL
jgi:hypothetical protein